jgi:hypothetical protein
MIVYCDYPTMSLVPYHQSRAFISFKVANYYSRPSEISDDDLNMLLRIRDCDYHQNSTTRLNLLSIWNIFNKMFSTIYCNFSNQMENYIEI